MINIKDIRENLGKGWHSLKGNLVHMKQRHIEASKYGRTFTGIYAKENMNMNLITGKSKKEGLLKNTMKSLKKISIPVLLPRDWKSKIVKIPIPVVYFRRLDIHYISGPKKGQRKSIGKMTKSAKEVMKESGIKVYGKKMRKGIKKRYIIKGKLATTSGWVRIQKTFKAYSKMDAIKKAKLDQFDIITKVILKNKVR